MTDKIAYLTPIVKPGSGKFVVYANLYSVNEKVLIVAKSSSLEIYNVFHDGLSLIDVVQLEDAIVALLEFTPRRFMLKHHDATSTEKQNLFYVLSDGSVHVIRSTHDGKLEFFHERPLSSSGDSDSDDESENHDSDANDIIRQRLGDNISTGGYNRISDLKYWAAIDSTETVIALGRSDGIVRLFFLSGKHMITRYLRSRGDADPVASGYWYEGNESTVGHTVKAGLGEIFSEIIQEDIGIRNILDMTMVNGPNSSNTKDRALAILNRSSSTDTCIHLLEIRRLAKSNFLHIKAVKASHTSGSLRIQSVCEPIGGYLEFGEAEVYYYNSSQKTPIISSSLPSIGIITVCATIDSTRYLIGSELGLLFLVILEIPSSSSSSSEAEAEVNSSPSIIPTGIKIQPTGSLGPLTSLLHLSGSSFMATSHLRSSMLFQLDIPSCLNNPALQPKIVHEIENLGPILDFIVREEKETKVNQIVACTGGVPGSLKKINSGIIPAELSEIKEIKGIQNIWTHQLEGSNSILLITSCIGHTRVFLLQGIKTGLNNDSSNKSRISTMSELKEWPGINFHSETITYGTFSSGSTVHVSGSTVTVVNANSLIHTWKAPPGKTISKAIILDYHVIICIGKSILLLGDMGRAPLIPLHTFEFDDVDYEISAISYLKGYILLSFWHSAELRLLTVDENDGFSLITSQDISQDFFFHPGNPYEGIRSLVLRELNSFSPLSSPSSSTSSIRATSSGPSLDNIQALVGLTDGSVILYDSELVSGRKVNVGSKPVTLFAYEDWVFCSSDKLAIAIDSETDFQVVVCPGPPRAICPLLSSRRESDDGSFVFVYDSGIQIVRLGNMTPLLIEELDLPKGSIPSRIVRLQGSNVMVLTDEYSKHLDNSTNTHARLYSIDLQTMKPVSTRKLPSHLIITSMAYVPSNTISMKGNNNNNGDASTSEASGGNTGEDVTNASSFGDGALDEAASGATGGVSRDGADGGISGKNSYCILGGEKIAESNLLKTPSWEQYKFDESVATQGLPEKKFGVLLDLMIEANGKISDVSPSPIMTEGAIYSVCNGHNRILAAVQSKVGV